MEELYENPTKNKQSENPLFQGETEKERLSEQIKKKVEWGLNKFGRICDFIDSCRDTDRGEEIISAYGLDDIREKCRYLSRLIEKDSSFFPSVDEARDFQHYAGNFVADLATLDLLDRFPTERRLDASIF